MSAAVTPPAVPGTGLPSIPEFTSTGRPPSAGPRAGRSGCAPVRHALPGPGPTLRLTAPLPCASPPPETPRRPCRRRATPSPEPPLQRARREQRPVERGRRREGRQRCTPVEALRDQHGAERGADIVLRQGRADHPQRPGRQAPAQLAQHRARHVDQGIAVRTPHVGHGEVPAIVGRVHPRRAAGAGPVAPSITRRAPMAAREAGAAAPDRHDAGDGSVDGGHGPGPGRRCPGALQTALRDRGAPDRSGADRGRYRASAIPAGAGTASTRPRECAAPGSRRRRPSRAAAVGSPTTTGAPSPGVRAPGSGQRTCRMCHDPGVEHASPGPRHLLAAPASTCTMMPASRAVRSGPGHGHRAGCLPDRHQTVQRPAGYLVPPPAPVALTGCGSHFRYRDDPPGPHGPGHTARTRITSRSACASRACINPTGDASAPDPARQVRVHPHASRPARSRPCSRCRRGPASAGGTPGSWRWSRTPRDSGSAGIPDLRHVARLDVAVARAPCQGCIMSVTRHDSGSAATVATDGRLAEAADGQAIEDTPPTAEAVAMFVMFRPEGRPSERRRAHVPRRIEDRGRCEPSDRDSRRPPDGTVLRTRPERSGQDTAGLGAPPGIPASITGNRNPRRSRPGSDFLRSARSESPSNADVGVRAGVPPRSAGVRDRQGDGPWRNDRAARVQSPGAPSAAVSGSRRFRLTT